MTFAEIQEFEFQIYRFSSAVHMRCVVHAVIIRTNVSAPISQLANFEMNRLDKFRKKVKPTQSYYTVYSFEIKKKNIKNSLFN